MKKNNILEITVKKKINVSKDVIKWNYWDHDHLDKVHGGYEESNILFEKNDVVFRVDTLKIPFMPFFKPTTPVFMVQKDNDTLQTFTIQYSVLSKTTIQVNELAKNKSEITMNYKFYLNGWRKILSPLLERLIPIWNVRVWREDLELKLRRQFVLNLGFKDFYGLPKNIEERKIDSNKEIVLPVPRVKSSKRDMHPLKDK